MTPERVRKGLDELRQQRNAIDEKLTALPDCGHEFRSDHSEYWFMTHPSASKPGKIQLTEFLADTPIGHTEWGSYLAASRSACGISAGCMPPSGSLDFAPCLR